MARRKRKEEADWVAPDFDEVGYMRREIQGAHAAVATILWAVVGASVAFLLISVSPYHTGYTLGLSCLTPRAGSVTNFPMALPNNSFYVLFRATDNAGPPTVRVNVTPSSQPGYDAVPTPLPDPSRNETRYSECTGHPSEVYPAGSFNVTIPQTASSFIVLITATDRTGRQAAASLYICPGCA